MSIALFVIGIILSGISTLVTVIFTIINLANGRSRNAAMWGGGFAVSLIILILSIFVTVRKVSQKVRDGVDWAKEQSTYNNNDYSSTDYKNSDRQMFLDTLQNYIHEKYDGKVPADFYINRAADTAQDGRIVMPFIYPYSVIYDSELYLGDIIEAGSGKVYAQNISQLAFDSNFVIAKIDNTNSPDLLKAGRGELEYMLFDLRSGEYEVFPSLKKLLEVAGKIGYTGTDLMNYLSDDYTGWIEYQEYD